MGQGEGQHRWGHQALCCDLTGGTRGEKTDPKACLRLEVVKGSKRGEELSQEPGRAERGEKWSGKPVQGLEMMKD